MKTILSILLMLSSSATFAAGNVGLSSLKVKVTGLYLSTSPLCTSPVTAYEDSNASYTDLVANPTIFRGQISSGVYSCVILRMSSVWKFTPSANDGTHCVSGTETSYDICQAGIDTDKLDGSVHNCTNAEDEIFVYLSTASTGDPATILGVFKHPITSGDNNNGYNMPNPFQVSGDLASTLTIGNVLSASLTDTGSVCELVNAPNFIFQ